MTLQTSKKGRNAQQLKLPIQAFPLVTITTVVVSFCMFFSHVSGSHYPADQQSLSGSDSENNSFTNWKQSLLIPPSRQISYKVGRLGTADYAHKSWALKFNYRCEGREVAGAMEPNLRKSKVEHKPIKYVGEKLSQSYLRREFYGLRLTFWCKQLNIHSYLDTSTRVGSETHFALFTIVPSDTPGNVTIEVSGVRKWNDNRKVAQHPVCPNIRECKYSRQESLVMEAIYETDQDCKVKFDCTCPPQSPWASSPRAQVEEAARLKYEPSGEPVGTRLGFEYYAQRMVEFCGTKIGTSADIDIQNLRFPHLRRKLRFLMENFNARKQTVKFAIST